MTATVRSVRVVLNAEVAKYIADMKMAGRATREAFGGDNNQPAWITKALGDVERSASKSGIAARKAGQEFDGLGAKAKGAGREVEGLGEKARKTDREIDRVSGRVRLLGEALFTLGPAAIPLTAGVLPALTGLGAAAGAAVGGVGVMALAFTGVGDALGALNDYQLEPTEAHLQALRQEMSSVGKDGREFVRFLDSLSTDMHGLQLIARDNMFPGVESGIESLLKRLPEARALIASLSAEVGDLAAEAGDAIAGGRFDAFVEYMGTDARPTLEALGHTLGNVTLGIANLFVAFAPATRDFTHGMEDASAAFARWSANLDDNQKFQDFLAYVRREGPEVVDLIESLATMLLGVAHAAAPVGNAVLPVLTSLANIIGVIGNSPLGPVLYTTAAAMVAVSRATKIAESTMGRFQTTSTATRGSLLGVSKTTVGILAVAGAVGVLGDKLADATGAKLKPDDLSRNLDAIAKGGGHETLERLTGDFDKLHASITDIGSGKVEKPLYELGAAVGSVFGGSGNTPWDNASDNIEQVDQALAQLVESGNADQAKKIFDQIAQAKAGGSVPGASIAPDLMKQLKGDFDSYSTAVANAGDANDGYAASTRGAAEAARMTKAQIDGLVASMQEQRAQALGAFDAETAWREALKAAGQQAKSNNAGIKGNTDAALANRSALSGLAAAWNSQSAAVKNSTARSRDARRAFIDMATGMGVPIAQARTLARRVLEIPRSRVVKVDVNGDGAINMLDTIAARIQRLQDRTIHITTVENKINAGSAGTKTGNHGQADGGTVPGERYPYGDKTLVLAAPGEEIITNRHGEADAFRRDRAAGRIPAYADGGSIGGGSADRRRPGPNQLGGLGSWASTNELAIRISNLTTRQIRSLGREMDNLGKKNLARLGKALDKATDLQQKQTDAAQKAFDDVKSRREGYASSINQGLTRDIFAGGGSAFEGKSAAGSVASANQQLALQGQDARDFERLEKILRGRGLHGDALEQVLSGGIDRVRTFAAASTTDLRTYQRRFDSAQAATTRASNVGAALLTPEFRALKDAYDEELAESKAIRDEIHALRAEEKGRHKQAEKTRGQAPKKTAAALTGSARRARRG